MYAIPPRPTGLLLLTALTALTAPALAQERVEPDIVVTAQRANQTELVQGGSLGALGDLEGLEAPFSVRSYTEALILNQQPLTLGEVLENDPTVRTTYGFGNAAEQFVIRGFPLFADDIGLDGLYGITPRQLVAPELYEQVQILNGASAFLFGAAPGGSGLGGTINLIPKRARATPLSRVTLSYVSDAHFGASFDVGRRFAGETIGVRVNGATRSGEVSIAGENRDADVLGASLDWRGERARLMLDIAYQRVRVDRLRPKVTVGTAVIPRVPDADANYAQPWTYTTLRDVFGIVRGEYDLAENALLYAAFGARDGSEEGVYGGITVLDASTGAATGSALFVPRTDNNEAGEIGLRWRPITGPVSHRISIGGAMSSQVNRNAFDFLGGFGGYATNLYDTPEVPLPGTGFVGGDLGDPFPIARTRLASLFASDTIGLFDDRLLLTGGVRWQGLRVIGFSYADGTESTRYDEDALTPVIGLVVRPTGTVSLFANRIEGLAQGPTAPTDPSIVNPGEVFPPTRSTQYELGAKLETARLALSIAAFRTERPSGIARPVDPSDPGGPLRFGLDGRQRNRGIEIVGNGEPLPGLRLIAGLSLIDARLRRTAGGLNDGNRAAGIPEFLFNANAEWDVPFLRGATLTARVTHSGEQPVNAANTLELEPWTSFDLGARYVAAIAERPVTLRLTVDNVGDARYWASAFDAFGAALLQGAPRTFRLSVSTDF